MAKKGGYGIGIVGCGMIADFHAQAIEAMKGGHLACVFSRSKANADRVAKAYHCASYQDYKAFLEHSGLMEEYKDKIVFGESVGQVNQYLTTGAADAAFTSYSFVTKFGDKYHFLEADPSYFSRIEQGMLILKYGKENHPGESRQFLDFLKSEACRDVLMHFGYSLD